MALFDKIRGTLESIFQIGRNGKQIKSNSNSISFVDTDGTTLIPIKIATNSADSDSAATVAYVNSMVEQLPHPTISGDNVISSGNSITNQIDNYDSSYNYSFYFTDTLLSATLNSDGSFDITAGTISDDTTHYIMLNLYVSTSGKISNFVSKIYVITP